VVTFSRQSFWAGTVVTAWVAPIAAATISIALYEANLTSPRIVLVWAILAALLFWVLTAIAYSPMTGAKVANSRSYWLLRARIDGLRNRQVKVCQAQPADPNCIEAGEGIAKADSMLDGSGLQWVSERGYIAVWERTHRAEEALMDAEDKDELLLDVEHELLQLKGAAIPLGDDLLQLVKEAKTFLSTGKAAPGSGVVSLIGARKALKEVRYNINVFRDNTWSGMVALRNQILSTLVLTELAGFAVLGLAILNSVDPKAVAVGALYFLIGAVFGLFNRLYSESQADHAVDDYGLAMAGIITLPVYAGMAGLGGVVLSSLASGQPSAASLSAVFDVQNHPLVLIAAAAFGLAPALLVGGLTKQVRQSTNAIKSTEAGQTGSQKGSGS
jgi:hypothetical protein